jgi:hypothetical protein
MVSPFLSLLYAYFISDSQLKNANLYTTVCPYKNRKSEGSNTQFQSLIHPKTRRKGKHALGRSQVMVLRLRRGRRNVG